MMTFYNYIENVRYEMFNLVNGWTRKGAETKARISQSLDQARYEYEQKKIENAKLRKLCVDLRFCKRHNCLTCSHGRFCDMHFTERYAELGIEVDE